MRALTRRQFVLAGIGGSVLLAGASWLKSRGSYEEVIPSLVPVVLAGALPTQESERVAAIAETAEAFHRAVLLLAPAIQEEIAELLALLAFAPTRIVVAGVAPAWAEARPDQIAAFLEDWRHSRFELKRSGYRALTQLIQGAWYDNPRAWKVVGYPGPPAIE